MFPPMVGKHQAEKEMEAIQLRLPDPETAIRSQRIEVVKIEDGIDFFR